MMVDDSGRRCDMIGEVRKPHKRRDWRFAEFNSYTWKYILFIAERKSVFCFCCCCRKQVNDLHFEYIYCTFVSEISLLSMNSPISEDHQSRQIKISAFTLFLCFTSQTKSSIKFLLQILIFSCLFFISFVLLFIIPSSNFFSPSLISLFF